DLRLLQAPDRLAIQAQLLVPLLHLRSPFWSCPTDRYHGLRERCARNSMQKLSVFIYLIKLSILTMVS
ncbi:MAG: hypothetical protein AAF657_32915, partial [Acidobacteriota bacterium]